ncbi:methyltransferase domain-containing protein [Streptomyces sp. NPDC001177]
MSDPVLEELPGDRVLVRAAGREFEIDAACPHRLGRLVHGHLNPRTLRITCPLHRSSFDLATGCPVTGPAERSLTVHRGGVLGRRYRPEQVWLPASERLLDWDDGFHDLMLGDRLRMTAYRTAITEAVRPGATVLDLGTGTGILARWALEAGAARVYGIDLNEKILATAAERLAAAGFGDRFHPLPGISFDLDLPEPVDLVISEIMGNLADNENCAAILDDARRRFLRPGGAMLPRAVESYLVPVAAERAHAQLRDGAPQDAGNRAGFAELLRRRGARNPFDLYYDTVVPAAARLAAPRLLRRYDFRDGAGHPAEYSVPLVHTVQRDGMFTGFQGYFVADLSDTVALDISGDDIGTDDPGARTTSDSWKHASLPVAEPVAVRRGDRIAVTFSRGVPTGEESFGQVYRWRGGVVSGETTIARFDQRTRPEETP